jgi:hypothetical protein
LRPENSPPRSKPQKRPNSRLTDDDNTNDTRLVLE